MNTEILPFTMDAYDRVFALWQQCEGVGLSDADSQASIQAYLTRNPGMSFIAIADGTVVGAVLGGHDGRRGYIHHLAVHPHSRRRSLGRRLVEQCLGALQRAGIQKCHIFIFNRNESGIVFWKSVGWTPRSDIGVISKNIEPSGAANGSQPGRSEAKLTQVAAGSRR
jgi:ribosomal protein S18 acetylase RimI-like enzyme